MKSIVLVILIGAVSAFVVACSSEVDSTPTVVPTSAFPPPPPPSAASSAPYLDSISNNAIQVSAAFAQIDEHLLRVWPVRSSLFDAFNESELSEKIISSVSAIVALSPPDEFEDDHEKIRNAATDIINYTREFEQALESRDLGGVMVAKANFAVSYKRMVLSVSPAICQVLGVGNDEDTLCTVLVAEPDSYEAAVEQLFKEYRIEFGPRVSSFPPAQTD